MLHLTLARTFAFLATLCKKVAIFSHPCITPPIKYSLSKEAILGEKFFY